MRQRRRAAAGWERGFTLVEVLVAFGVMALLASIFFNGLSDGLRGLGRAERVHYAQALAETLLARAGREIPLADERRSGTDPAGFEWTLSIALTDQVVRQDGGGVSVYRVDVNVVDARRRAGAVRLRTVKLGPQP